MYKVWEEEIDGYSNGHGGCMNGLYFTVVRFVAKYISQRVVICNRDGRYAIRYRSNGARI